MDSNPMTHKLESLLEFAKRYTEAWCSLEPARVAGCYSAGGSLTINDGEPAVGHEAIAEAARSFMTAFPDMQVLLDGLELRGDRALYRWTLKGTNTGPGGTGNSVRISGFEEWRIGEDGRIAESQGHFDGAEYQRQVEHGVDGSRQV